MNGWNQFRGDERNRARIAGTGLTTRPTQAWQVELSGALECPPIVDADTVYVGSSDGNLYAFDRQGRRRWVYETTTPTSIAPAVSGYRLCVVLDDRLVGIDSARGTAEWERPIDGLYTTPPTVDGDLGLVGSSEGVTAFRLEDGEQIWTRDLGAPPVGAPAIGSSHVYVATRDEDVHALELGSGETAWSAPTDGVVVGGPTLTDERAYVADDSGTLLALDPETGQTWFSYEIRAPFASAPTVLEDSDTLLVTAADETLHITDTTFGNRKRRGWLFSKPGLGLDGAPTTDPVCVGENAFVADDTGGLYGVDLEGLDFTWHLPLEAPIAATPAPLADGDLFVGDESGVLTRLTWP
ncbi:PQQ-binding-like beta-propeller repeat protein [Halobacteria archaeon AArc-curdl1]|uniref:PQQ-binding-like beta-propeller repeat protein n=1 Tax=Natronosalvus hydrolyticus TaxID=2979988 RepID=A0AAP3E7M0_9EURY|nr:PQQ-binding-like beta-propeller repeat protein [Halobacteria archaeon AArc-curdl1]